MRKDEPLPAETNHRPQESKVIPIILAIAFVIIAGALYLHTRRANAEWVDISREREREAIAQIEAEGGADGAVRGKMITVHIAGAVMNPGVYDIEADSRVTDLVDLAGGGTAQADFDAVNLAARLIDAQRITIPEKNDGTAAAPADPPEVEPVLININTATAEELQALPGIGAVRASDIVAHRERNGPFSEIADIKNVPGIGEGIFQRIESFITH